VIEAAKLMMAHRRFDGIAELVRPVLEARCGHFYQPREGDALPLVWKEAQRHLGAAEDATDPAVARCEWTEAAAKYEAVLHQDIDHGTRNVAALNGAYAYRQSGRAAVAAEIYAAHIRAHARPIPGEDERSGHYRHKYAVMACRYRATKHPAIDGCITAP
jgi:hypothetical protein